MTSIWDSMNAPSDLIAFAIALVGSLCLTVPVRRFALQYGMVDHPGPRKVHLRPVPLLGGIAIYLGFVLAILLTMRAVPQQQMTSILAGATLLAVVGGMDDGRLHPEFALTFSLASFRAWEAWFSMHVSPCFG
jgi:UDP-GlcNAc:undecaprenyl-phosphate GlcNAc-1-phosphate transferase